MCGNPFRYLESSTTRELWWGEREEDGEMVRRPFGLALWARHVGMSRQGDLRMHCAFVRDCVGDIESVYARRSFLPASANASVVWLVCLSQVQCV